MKKPVKFLGILFALLITAAFIIPLFVDVDKYRPQIVQAANEKINGTLELGKLSLSLWGQIRMEVAGLKVFDSSRKEVLTVEEAYFYLPLTSVFSGSPVLTFKMNHPTVNVVKNRSGKFNLMTLPKAALPAVQPAALPKRGTPAAATNTANPANINTANTTLPAMVANARLGVELNHALINYSDDLSGLKSDVKDLNLILKDISLSHPTEIEVWADLDSRLGKVFSLRGPARLTGQATPSLGKNIDGALGGTPGPQLRLTAKLDLDGLEIAAPGLFEKKPGTAANAELNLQGSENQIKIESLLAKFFNMELKIEGTVSQLTTVPKFGFLIHTNEIQLKPWTDLIPMLKDYDLGGSTQLDLDVKGTTDQPSYRGMLVVNSLSAKLPKFKISPKFDSVVILSNDQVENVEFTMKAPGNDLKLQGRIVSFSRPRMDFKVTSSGMDLDQLIEFPPRKKGSTQVVTSETAPGDKAGDVVQQIRTENGAAASGGGTSFSGDYDEMLSPLRTNKVLAATELNLALDLKSMKAYQVKMNNLACIGSYKGLIADLKNCGLNIFSGTLKAASQMNFKSKAPVYSFTGEISGLEMSQAVESQMALFKNTLTGKASASFRAQGSSFNPEAAKASFSGTGNMKVEQAVFATIDVMKMMKGGLDESLGKLGEKIPALKETLKGNNLASKLPNSTSKYKIVTADFTIADQKFKAPNFFAQAQPNEGIDIKGNTAVGFKDYSLSTNWEVIDTYNLTHLRDISVDESGVHVPHIFAEGSAPVHFTVNAGCTVIAPCYSYVEVPAYLSKVALNNIGNALTGKAKDEVKKKAETLIDQLAPKEVSSDLKNKLKGLFH